MCEDTLGHSLWKCQKPFDLLTEQRNHTRHETLSLTFAYQAMFCKIYRYPKQINYFNFKLTDIDNTKPPPKLGSVYD